MDKTKRDVDLSNTPKINITVNGNSYEVKGNTNILEALIEIGVHVPHLCYDSRLIRSNGSCGLCVVELQTGNEKRMVKACQTPVSEGMILQTATEEIKSYRKLRLDQLLADHNGDCVAPCVNTCPAHIDIQAYLKHVANGNYAEALKVIKERNPFPLACGRVCPHPCEYECRRNLVDEPVAINYVKRFAADWDLAQPTQYIPTLKAASGKKVAVIGGGPAGLSAAYYSAINGHDVTVFERLPEAGGMLRYGIPEYRLPKKTLDREIDTFKKMGIKIQTNKALGVNVRLDELKKEYDAIFLGIGSWKASSMNIEGEQAQNAWLGINYLAEVTKGEDIKLGDDVVVIGGGNTAIDCVRVALRRGAKNVKLVYRRSKEEMPAEPYEIEEALHEGVEMIFLTAPVKIVSDSNNNVTKVICRKMQLGEPDRSGRRRPVEIEGSDFEIKASAVIGAIGQATDATCLWNDLPVQLSKWGDIEAGKGMQTSAEGIFAAGDCVTGPATVVQAVGAGRVAATAMDEYLTKGFVSDDYEEYNCSRGTLEDLPRDEFQALPKFPRAKMPSIPMASRKLNFNEVETGLSEEAVRAEASRCLECGCSERYGCRLRNEATDHCVKHNEPLADLPYIPLIKDHPYIIRDQNKCISCGRCVAACGDVEGPDVLGFDLIDGKLLVCTKSGLPLNETDCVGCGQCVTACPCGALTYRREMDNVFQAINDPKKTTVAFVAPAVRSVVAKYFNLTPEQSSPFMAGIFRKLGFDKVFDVSFTADMTILEEVTELVGRITNKGKMPMFTSCCPGWVNFVEKRYPELMENLSSCKSPQQMFGSIIKNHYPTVSEFKREDLFVTSIMPCIAKKYEAARPEFAPDGIRDVDAVLTTTEVLEMLQKARIDLSTIECEDYDKPYQKVSSAGILFGNSGGVMEAALRYAAEVLSGKKLEGNLVFEDVRGLNGLKECKVEAGGVKLRLAVINGLSNAEPLLQKLIDGEDIGYDFIEIMACPGGCIGGAGHPVPEDWSLLEKREEVLWNIDKTAAIKKSQDNPDLIQIYKDYLKEPNSHLAHKLLHTHYHRQKGDSNLLRKRKPIKD